LLGILLPFLLWEDTLLAYVLIFSPIYLVYSSRTLAGCLLLTALLWPSVTERNLSMRLALLVDAAYIAFFAPRVAKYKMTPTKVHNNDFVLLI
jgi:hypothetical protein